jgi:hypothetical protein
MIKPLLLDRLTAINARFPQLAWSKLGLGSPLWDAGATGATMLRMLKALRRLHGM